MYIVLISFFVSLFGIIFMLGRKLALVKNGTITDVNNFHPFSVDVRKMRSFVWRKMRIEGYATLVLLVRAYIHIRNFVKQTYEKIKIAIKNNLNKGKDNLSELGDQQEVSKFLQKISDYKQRIRVIKDKIEREKNL